MSFAEAGAVVRDGTVYIDAAITVDHEEGLREMLKNGATLELALTVDIERHRTWWTNAEAAAANYALTLKHEPLTREFVATIPAPGGVQELRSKNLTRLLHKTWKQLELPLISLEELKKENAADEYTVYISATLRHTDVPPWLKNTGMFWSADVVPGIKTRFPFVPQKHWLEKP